MSPYQIRCTPRSTFNSIQEILECDILENEKQNTGLGAGLVQYVNWGYFTLTNQRQPFEN